MTTFPEEQDNGPVHAGFTRAQLEAAFEKIKPASGNWKDPIRATIAREDFRACDAACVFYCGCSLRVVRTGRTSLDDIRWTVTAPGYYAAVGA